MIIIKNNRMIKFSHKINKNKSKIVKKQINSKIVSNLNNK